MSKEIKPSRAYLVVGNTAVEFHSLDIARRHQAANGGQLFKASEIACYGNTSCGPWYSLRA